MEHTYSTIMTTCTDRQSAKALAKGLLEERLAACVQILPIESMYVWKGEICNDNEVLLLIKSKTSLFKEISATIVKNHSYEVPEIVQIPITDGLSDYLAWIEDHVVAQQNGKA